MGLSFQSLPLPEIAVSPVYPLHRYLDHLPQTQTFSLPGSEFIPDPPMLLESTAKLQSSSPSLTFAPVSPHPRPSYPTALSVLPEHHLPFLWLCLLHTKHSPQFGMEKTQEPLKIKLRSLSTVEAGSYHPLLHVPSLSI